MKQYSSLYLAFAVWSAASTVTSAFYWSGGLECKDQEQGVLCAHYEAIWWNPPHQGPPLPESEAPAQPESNVPMASPISSYPTTPNTSDAWLYWTQYNYVARTFSDPYEYPYPPTITSVELALTYSNTCSITVDGETCNSCKPCSETSYEEEYTFDCTNIPFGRKTTQCESGARGQIGGEFLEMFFFPLTSDSPAIQSTSTSPAPSSTVNPSPTVAPTLTATSYVPSFVGNPSPTVAPTLTATSYAPSFVGNPSPTAAPTLSATTVAPTLTATSYVPSFVGNPSPTVAPTLTATSYAPSFVGTPSPTLAPTFMATSFRPSLNGTPSPTISPTLKSTSAPSPSPTNVDTLVPTSLPTLITTETPVSAPTAAPTNKSSLLNLILVNPRTNEDVKPIQEGSVLDLAELLKWNVRLGPDVVPEGVASVEFKYDGERFRVENVAPYALVGDVKGDYYDWWSPGPGEHTILATAYDSSQATGTVVGSVSVTFTVKDSSRRNLRSSLTADQI